MKHEQILLVGEDNPFGSDEEFALYPRPPGCAGQRLCDDILGLSEREYLWLKRTNLCAPRWSMPQAKVKAESLLDPWNDIELIVLLGRKVAEAFGFKSPAFSFERRLVLCDVMGDDPRSKILVSLPHPSGRNARLWTPQNKIRARGLLRGLVPEVAWGA